MSISAVGVSNVNDVNTVNNRREQLKQKRNFGIFCGLAGLGLSAESLNVKSPSTGMYFAALGFSGVLLCMYNFLKANKELNELNKQQNLSIKI